MCFETFTYNPHIYSWNHIWQLVKILGIILAVAIHVSLCLVISCQGSEGSPPPCCVWLHGEKRPAMDIDVRNHAHENVETCTNKCIKNPATFQTKTQDPRGSNRALYVSKMVSTVEFLDHTWKMSKNHCPYIYLSYLPIYIYLYCFFFFFQRARQAMKIIANIFCLFDCKVFDYNNDLWSGQKKCDRKS